MAQSINTDANKKNPSNTSAFTDQDTQSTFDAFDFLYNAVPFGEYPEATSEAIHNKDNKTNFQYE